MESKFYVSLEAARLLKEKGYNEQCYYCFYYDDYHDKWDFDSPYNLFDDEPMYYNNETIDDEMYSMPTKAEAIDWLESKGLIVDTKYYSDRGNNRGKWSANINIKDSWACVAIGEYYLTRLEAEDAAIIKALKLL